MTARQFGILSGIAATGAATYVLSEAQKQLCRISKAEKSELIRDGIAIAFAFGAGGLIPGFKRRPVQMIVAQAALAAGLAAIESRLSRHGDNVFKST